jgi:hypothetical protein
LSWISKHHGHSPLKGSKSPLSSRNQDSKHNEPAPSALTNIMTNPYKSPQFLILGTVSHPESGEVAVMRALEDIESRETFHLKIVRADGKTNKCLRHDLVNYFYYGRRLLSRIKCSAWEGSLNVQIAAVRLVCATCCLKC